MLTPRSLPFFQGARTLRRVRSGVQLQLQDEPALVLLPTLRDVPLVPTHLIDPAAILAQMGGLALCGSPHTGRSLTLLQIRARWAAVNLGVPLISLDLVADDAANLSPRAVVAGAIHRAGLSPDYAEGGRPLLLLLDEWENLPPDRRTLWRNYVSVATAWPAARVVMSLPPDEQWPGMKTVQLTPPDDATLITWLAHLIPGHDPQPIMTMLSQPSFAVLRSSIGDLLLLAMIYPIASLPHSRVELYEQAYALSQPLLDAHTPRLLVGRAILRFYQLARSLAGGTDMAMLTTLPAHEIAVVAPLTVALLGNLRPVLHLLWSDATPPTLANLHGLAACLCENPTAMPEEQLGIAMLLNADRHQELRNCIIPALPATFAAAAQIDLARTLVALHDLAEAWPSADVALLLAALLDQTTLPDALRWQAADLLITYPRLLTNRVHRAADRDMVAQMTWAYVIACREPEQRHLLLEEAVLSPGLEALLSGHGGAERRLTTISALVSDVHAPSELRSRALAYVPPGPLGVPLLQRALVDQSLPLRRAALTLLAGWPSNESLTLLATALVDIGYDESVLHDTLMAVGAISQPEATGIIVRVILNEQQRLALRIAALCILARRSDGLFLLPRFLVAERMPIQIRATAARMIGRVGLTSAIPRLHAMLGYNDTPLLRRAVVAALIDLAAIPEGRRAAVRALMTVIARPDLDTSLIAQVAIGLGTLGVTAAIPLLVQLIQPDYTTILRANWLAALPALESTPASAWSSLPLTAGMRTLLLDTMAIGATIEDQPSSLDELVLRQNEHIAVAVVNALAAIATLRPDLAPELCTYMRQVLFRTQGMHSRASMFAALAQVAQTDMTNTLAAILDNPSASPYLRWEALDQLGATIPTVEWVITRLRRGGDDLFIQSKLVMIMGMLADQRVVADLEVIATTAAQDLRLRTYAAEALGMIGGSSATYTLLALIRASDAPIVLRIAAVRALRHPLSVETTYTLRQIAHTENGGATLTVAIAKALAEDGEHEVLPILLRIAQSEHNDEAMEAIQAIGDLGDILGSPVLVRISQNTHSAPSVRLAAIAALLQLDSVSHLTLLRAYLNTPILPLRIRAHQLLAQFAPLDAQLIAPLSDPQAPLLLRLAALDQAPHQPDGIKRIGTIIQHADEPIQLRLAGADALGASSNPAAVPFLVAALASVAPPLFHRHCIVALGKLAATGQSSAETALISLVQSTETLIEIRQWAADLLLEYTVDRIAA